MDARECPSCGEWMRLQSRETAVRVPGTSQAIRTVVHEWICGECDHVEEAEDLGVASRE